MVILHLLFLKNEKGLHIKLPPITSIIFQQSVKKELRPLLCKQALLCEQCNYTRKNRD